MKAHFLGLLAGTSLLLAATPRTHAALTYDLRLNDNDTSGGVITYPGEVIALDLFARVTGVSAGVEGFQEGYGSIIGATSGGISGSLSATIAAPFQANGAQAGTSSDLNGDSVLDLGSNLTVASSDFFFARASQMQTTGGTPILSGTGMEFKLGTIYFTASSTQPLIGGSTLNISFRITAFTNPTNIDALWMQDGVTEVSSLGGNAPLPTAGAGVTLSAIPEPSSALLLGFGAVAACVQRRRRR